MDHKARRYITIFLTAAFCVCAFSAAVFAETGAQTDPEDHSASSEASSGSSEQSSAQAPSSDPFIPAQIQVTLVYDNGEQTQIKTVDVGTTVSALPTPSRKGYRFSGWASGGSVLSSSHALNHDTTLTASWTKLAQSSAAHSSKPSQSSQKPVDTRQSEVEALASEADQATSDPDALSSQDWSELLSSPSASSASPASKPGTASSSPDSTTSGGASWLFPAGIALIVLALGGIGLFVYLQFFSGRGGKGPRGGGKGPGGHSDEGDDTMTFTDVSSFSNPTGHAASGRNPDLEDTIPIGPGRKVSLPPAGKPPVSGQSETVRKAPQEPLEPTGKPEEKSPLPMSQAKPVASKEGEKSDFDWEKFFHEDDELPR